MDDALLFLAYLGAAAAGLALAGALYGPSPTRKGLSLAVSLCLPALAWNIPASAPATAGLTAILTALAAFKWVQSHADDDRGGLAYRIWQWTSLFDVRLARRARPSLEFGLIARSSAGLALFAAARFTIQSRPADGVSYLLGVVAVISLADAVSGAVRVTHAAFGWKVGPIMDNTFVPKSVENFWGRRWNRTVSRWLRRIVFRPTARRYGALAGLVSAFAVSAAVHFYITCVPLGVTDGLLCGAFFLLQIPLIVIERRVIPPAARRPYAYAALLLTAPAFVLPFNAILRGA
ncbi:MAG: MBOAT family protein [Myxococcota bacterium]